MKLYFGLNWDSVVYPVAGSEVGVHYFGTKGLFKLLESLLGLEGYLDKMEHVRVEEYRQALYQYRKTHADTFFSESFETDSLGCAESMLAYRDELIFGGWSPELMKFGGEGFVGGVSRLVTFGELEEYYQPSVLGRADRFCAILLRLERAAKLGIEEIWVNEPRELLPYPIVKLLDCLREKHGVVVGYIEPPRVGNLPLSDLDVLKSFIYNPDSVVGERHLKNDGSLILLKGERDTDLAVYLAKLLHGNVDFQPVLLLPDNSKAVEDALIHEGKSALGTAMASPARPTVQLLKLVTSFLWRPLDPYKVLEFVTLASKPLDDRLAHIIANQMSQRPGINSDAWYAETSRYFEKMAELAKLDPSVKAAEIKKQYDFWFDRKRYDMDKAVPKSEVLLVFEYLGEWAGEEFERVSGKNTSLLVLAEQAKRIVEYLETLPKNDNFLSYLELERIIRTIYEPSPVQSTPQEIGFYSHITHSTALLEDVDSLVWWNFNNTKPSNFFSRWYKQEVLFLEQLGVKMSSPKDENALLIWEQKQPILRTQERLMLIIPHKVNGGDVAEHSLFAHLHACFKNLDGCITDIGGGDFGKLEKYFSRLPGRVDLLHQPLPRPEPFLELPNTNLNKREAETLTSLESLFYYPYQWVFRHKARLNKSHILSIAKDETLMGNLSHRFFELALKEDIHVWTRAYSDRWVDTISRRLLAREASVLMMYGQEPERMQFINYVKYALWALISLIKDNGWRVHDTEMNLHGNFYDIPIKGKADLVLEKDGELAVVDLKWSGLSRRRDLIKNEEDLQLVMYSQLIGEPDAWAHTAYFIIKNAKMVARNHDAFDDTIAVAPNAERVVVSKGIWDKMLKTYIWRIEQIQRGAIEIRTQSTSEALEDHYGEELIDVLEMKREDAKYDDYRTLIGVW
jgi:hypothetical protein